MERVILSIVEGRTGAPRALLRSNCRKQLAESERMCARLATFLGESTPESEMASEAAAALGRFLRHMANADIGRQPRGRGRDQALPKGDRIDVG